MNSASCGEGKMKAEDRNELIELCYASVTEIEGYQLLIEKLSQEIGADAADIVLENTSSKSCVTYGTLGFDPAFLENYDTKYLGKNIWFEELEKLAPDRSHTDTLFSRALKKSAYFNEWVKPQGLEHSIGAVLESQSDSNGWIGLCRSTGSKAFSDRERAVLDLVLPHLKRSLILSKQLNTNNDQLDVVSLAVSTLSIPVIILDCHGRVVEMNSKADKFLSGHSQLKISVSGHIQTHCGRTHAKIGQAIYLALTALDEPNVPPPSPVVVKGAQPSEQCLLEAAHFRGSEGMSGAVVILKPIGERCGSSAIAHR